MAKRKKSKKKLGQTGVKSVRAMDSSKIPKQMCKRAVYLLDSTLEDYRRGRTTLADFKSQYEMAERLNIPVHCKTTGKQVKRIMPVTRESKSMNQIKCFCYPPKKWLSGRRKRG